MITVRSVTPADRADWLAMRCALWPDDDPAAEHALPIDEFFAGEWRRPCEVLLAFDADGAALGFAELSVRDYAEGCRTDHVAFLEGWYVVPDARRSGVGRRLMQAAFEWGRSQGCTEFASDTRIDNHDSIAAHLALGFDDAGAVHCFRRDL